MIYLNFIDYLINPEKFEGLYRKIHVNEECEALIVCLKDSLDIN